MTNRAFWAALLTFLATGCVHHTQTQVEYDPVDVRSRTDLVGLTARQFGFERARPEMLDLPVHLAFAWVRDTRAFPHFYGTDQGRLSGVERQELSDVLGARLNSPPFAPVTRIPAPAASGGPSPLAVPAMPVASATRRAARTGKRLGADVVIVVQTRSEELTERNLLWPVAKIDPSSRIVPGEDLSVHVRAEACAVWAERGALIECREATGDAFQPWVSGLQTEVIFADLRQRALADALTEVADEMVTTLLPLTAPPELRPEDADAAMPPEPSQAPAAGTPEASDVSLRSGPSESPRRRAPRNS